MSKLVAAVVLFVCMLADAKAQENNKVGLVMASPAVIGFEWEITPRLALRPDFAFSRGTNSNNLSNSTSSNKSAAVGVSALFYVRNLTPLRVYLSPRFSHQLSRTANLSTTAQSALSGSIGAQYDLGIHFGMFAEAGVGYSHSRTTNGGTNSVLTSTSLGNRATLGAILFF